jgi:ABC-type Mn2+/Zn2+ transport system ATPase subunit
VHAVTTHPLLRVADLSVAFDGRPVLAGVGFEVGEGELVAVVGPNGAGKSTLFRAITGLVPHTGTVELCGAHCHHQRDRLGAAYLPQRANLDLDFPITVGQLALAGRRRFLRIGGRPGDAHRAAAMDALGRVGLADHWDRPLTTLSGGQIQRAFLARALAQEAHLLLLDEALSGVDQPRAESLLDLFAELASRGTSLLVATHDLALARRRFDRCIAVNGRVVADGDPRSVLGAETIVATFGAPPMTTVPGSGAAA